MKSISYEGYTVREDGKVIGKFGKEILFRKQRKNSRTAKAILSRT